MLHNRDVKPVVSWGMEEGIWGAFWRQAHVLTTQTIVVTLVVDCTTLKTCVPLPARDDNVHQSQESQGVHIFQLMINPCHPVSIIIQLLDMLIIWLIYRWNKNTEHLLSAGSSSRSCADQEQEFIGEARHEEHCASGWCANTLPHVWNTIPKIDAPWPGTTGSHVSVGLGLEQTQDWLPCIVLSLSDFI